MTVDAASTRTSWMWPVHRVLSSTQTNRRTRWPTPSSSSSMTTSAFTSRTSASSRRSRRWRRTSRSAAKGEEGEICPALTLHLVFYVNVNLKKRLCFVIHRLTENMRRLSECFRLSGCSEFVLVLRQYLYWLENSLWIINQKIVPIFFSVKYWNIELYSLCLFFPCFPERGFRPVTNFMRNLSALSSWYSGYTSAIAFIVSPRSTHPDQSNQSVAENCSYTYILLRNMSWSMFFYLTAVMSLNFQLFLSFY